MAVKSKGLLGGTLVFISAASFAFMTYAIKAWGRGTGISPYQYAFTRFALGWLVIMTYIIMARKHPIPHKKGCLILRGATNAGAVILLFLSVGLTTLTKANLLNMTYPIWVAVLSPFMLKEHITKTQIFALILSIIGIWFVVNPDFSNFCVGDILALASGITMGIAVASLRRVRKTEDAHTTLLVLFSIGIIMTLPFVGGFVKPNGKGLLALAGAAIFGVLGQLSINAGMKHIRGLTGAIISTSRLVIAAFLGIVFLTEPMDTMLLIGGIIIILSIVWISRVPRRA